ncbi:hypothetical protein [Kribbella deserti]|uniref:DUF222 domain-containing protein n=1 Tax=Kribbella deserti TaxID=1926257 RepID=A0ABV6QGX6_9ACTN
MTRAEALAVATETVNKLAPPTNARGYTDGASPLRERGDLIIRMAEFLCASEPAVMTDPNA